MEYTYARIMWWRMRVIRHTLSMRDKQERREESIMNISDHGLPFVAVYLQPSGVAC